MSLETGTRREHHRFMVALALLALAVRLLPVFAFRDVGIALDMYQYDMLARSLADGNGYRWFAAADAQSMVDYLARYGIKVALPEDPRGILTSFRAPLYPVLLSLVYRLTGDRGRFFYARIVQAALGACLALLTYLLALAAGKPERSSRVAGLVVSTYPILIFYPLGLVTENLFIPLLVLNIIALIAARRTGKLLYAILSGVVAGLVALTRSLVVVLWPVFVVWLKLGCSDRRRANLLTSAMTAAMIMVTLPWSIRNTLLHGQVMWLESSLGYVLYLGYYPTSTGTVAPETTMCLLTIQDDAQRNRVGLNAALSFITSNPRRAAVQVIQRLGTTWGLEWREFRYLYHNNFFGEWPPGFILMMLCGLGGPLVILMPSALYGISLVKPDLEQRLLLAVIFSLVMVHAFTLADPRYHLPLIPFLAVFAADGWTAAKSQRGLKLAIAGTLPFLVVWSLEIVNDWGRLATLLGPGGNSTYWGY